MTNAASGEGEEDGKYSSLRRMTPEVLRSVCMERNMWNQPHLNTQLFLNYKGFEAIAGLEDYMAVRSLHLGNNNIAKIEGLDRMSDLRSLDLQGNRIRLVDGLEGNKELRQLNLENNGIQSLGCLDYLVKLEHLNLSRNNIEALESLEGLKSLPALGNVDVSHNRIEATEGIVEFWAAMPAQVKVLRYHGNPGIRNIENYRKRLINALPSLTYLDERPVLPVERRSCAAWAEGGLQAMHKAKRAFHEERQKLETTVDPERREFLTRMRKAALARIEREEREREEQEEQRRLGKTASTKALAPAATDGGGEDSATQGDGAASSQKAQETAGPGAGRGGFGFAPPARGAPQGRWAPQAPQGASTFISSRSNEKDDVEDRLIDRQFAVLGDDPWTGTAAPDKALQRSVEKEFGLRAGGARGGAGNKAPEKEVIPQIWESMRESNNAEELKALDQNLSHSRRDGARGAGAAAPAAEPAGAQELQALD